MTMRPCLTCGEPCDGPRCPDHTHSTRHRGSARKRGYGHQWDKLSARARKMQPWCLDCGSTENLQADHLPSAWERHAAGKTIRLADIEIVCNLCNVRRGSSRPGEGPRAGSLRTRLIGMERNEDDNGFH